MLELATYVISRCFRICEMRLSHFETFDGLTMHDEGGSYLPARLVLLPYRTLGCHSLDPASGQLSQSSDNWVANQRVLGRYMSGFGVNQALAT